MVDKIKALKETRKKVDQLVDEINSIIRDTEKEIKDSVDNICSRIEADLKDIYHLTDEAVYETRHVNFTLRTKDNKIHHAGLGFNGAANTMYFLDTERAWGHKDDRKEYHIILGEHSDGSGKHYYEDGRWRDDETKELFAAQWDSVKDQILNSIANKLQNYQQKKLENAIKEMNNTEERLAKLNQEEIR